jgi:hypothetical protein
MGPEVKEIVGDYFSGCGGTIQTAIHKPLMSSGCAAQIRERSKDSLELDLEDFERFGQEIIRQLKALRR